jgi:hypothetical protein
MSDPSPAALVLGLPLNLVIAVFSAAAVLLLSLVLLCFCKGPNPRRAPDLSDVHASSDLAAPLHADLPPESQRSL